MYQSQDELNTIIEYLKTKFSDEDISIIVAMIIGDGHVVKDYHEFSIGHGPKQEFYIHWKAKLLSNILKKEINVKPTIKGIYPGFRFSATHHTFKEFRKICYIDKSPFLYLEVLNLLTPKGIAIWFMDDGSFYPKKRNGKIHTHELVISTCCDEISIDNVIQYFAIVHNVYFDIKYNKNKYSVRCGTKEAKKFIEIIKPFILDDFLYKINFQKN